jgi:hypothetical protein
MGSTGYGEWLAEVGPSDPIATNLEGCPVALIVFYLILLVVTSYAIATGGRFERLAGGMMILSAVLATTAQKLTHNPTPLGVLTAIDLLLGAGLAWIAWRYRRPWILLILLAQACVFLIDLGQLTMGLFSRAVYSNTQVLLAYFQVAALGCGVLWRVYGPPAEPREPPPATS